MRYIKLAIGTVLYAIGVMFAFYIVAQMFGKHAMFTSSGVLKTSAIYSIVLFIGTVFLVSSAKQKSKKSAVVKGFFCLLLLFYVLILFFLLFYSSWRRMGYRIGIHWTNINLVPLKTIVEYFDLFRAGRINQSIVYENLIGNIAAFAPMGILLPCIHVRFRNIKFFTVVMLLLLVGVEAAQFYTNAGICDIDDVILNYSGAIATFGVFELIMTDKRKRKLYLSQ